MHNLSNGLGWESDRPIVAGKRVTTVERRGLTVNMSLWEGRRSAWLKSPQRRYEDSERSPWTQFSILRQRLGQKAKHAASTTVVRNCMRTLRREFRGEPDAGNPHVRFYEGGGGRFTRLLLYSTG